MSYLPDDCSECSECGVPIFGWGGTCDQCANWPPRDDRGRFTKWPEPSMYPENGDRVEVHWWGHFEGWATIVNDYRDDDLMSGHMIVRIDDGTERDIHPGYMTVIERPAATTP